MWNLRFCVGVLSCSASSDVDFTNSNIQRITSCVYPEIIKALCQDQTIFTTSTVVGFSWNPAVVVDRQSCVVVSCLESPDKRRLLVSVIHTLSSGIGIADICKLSLIFLQLCITGCTVAQHCYKGDYSHFNGRFQNLTPPLKLGLQKR